MARCRHLPLNRQVITHYQLLSPISPYFLSVSGATWSRLWDWVSYPTMNRYYSYSDTKAPWLGPDGTVTDLTTQIGWMIEGLSIDPFDSVSCS